MLIAKLLSFIKETLTDAFRTLTSREGLKSLYGIPLYRNAVYLMLNSAILALTGFFFWAIAARLYPVEGVGLASAAISAMALLAALSTLGLTYGLIRFLPKAGKKSRDMINSCFTLGILTSIALSLIFLAGLPSWSPALLPIRGHPVFFAAFMIFTAAMTLQSFTQQTFVAQRKTQFALWEGLIFGLLRFIPLILLAAFFHTFGIFVSWGIAASIAIVVSIFFFLPKIQPAYRPLPTISKVAISDLMHFSFANYAANLFWSIPGLILPLTVVNILGAESNAYFYIGWAVGGVLLMIPLAASFSLFAEGSHNEERLVGDVKRSLKLILLLLIPAIIIIFALGDKILLLFGSAYSENAARLLRLLALSAFPVSLNYIYFSIKRIEMRMRSVIGLTAFIAVGTLALSYVLLPQIGILGAGVAWLAVQIIAAMIVGYKLVKLSLSH